MFFTSSTLDQQCSKKRKSCHRQIVAKDRTMGLANPARSYHQEVNKMDSQMECQTSDAQDILWTLWLDKYWWWWHIYIYIYYIYIYICWGHQIGCCRDVLHEHHENCFMFRFPKKLQQCSIAIIDTLISRFLPRSANTDPPTSHTGGRVRASCRLESLKGRWRKRTPATWMIHVSHMFITSYWYPMLI